MLVQMHDFHGWEMGALWEDIKFDMKHFGDIERLALVGESKWEEGMAILQAVHQGQESEYFDEAKLAEAEEWIHAELPAPR